MRFVVFPRYSYSDATKDWYWKIYDGETLIAEGRRPHHNIKQAIREIRKLRLHGLFAKIEVNQFPKEIE